MTTTSDTAAGDGGAHILLYPFSGSGHIIPLLELAHRLLVRGLTLTIVISSTDLPLVQSLLYAYPASFHTLLLSPKPTPSSLLAKLLALKELDGAIIQWYHSHPSPPVAIISDSFLGWTHHLAAQFGIPRIAFCSTGAFSTLVFHYLYQNRPKNKDPDNPNFKISLPDIPNSPNYPWWQVSRVYRSYTKGDPDWEFFRNSTLENMESWGAMFNSFTVLESDYINHVKKLMGHIRVWAVGPLLPPDDDLVKPTNRGGSSSVPSHEVMTWLDELADDSVVYVCFGSRATLTSQQMSVLAAALEGSGVHFIWSVREPDGEDVSSGQGVIPVGFEGRVVGRGFMIKGWAPQVEILRHRAVGAFLTHCGWNSLLEGLSAGVVLLTWPTGADQFANANLLVDLLGVGRRVCEGGGNVPSLTELTHLLADSVGSTSEQRVRIKKLRENALQATNGGSSACDLDDLLKCLNEVKHKS